MSFTIVVLSLTFYLHFTFVSSIIAFKNVSIISYLVCVCVNVCACVDVHVFSLVSMWVQELNELPGSVAGTFTC